MPTCQTSTTYQMHNCNQLHTNAKLLVYIINQMQWKQAKQSLAARCHKAQVQENMRPAHLAIAEFKRAPAPSHEILQSKVPMVDHLSTHWNQTQLAGNQAFPIDLTRGRAPAVLSMTATLLSTYIYIYTCAMRAGLFQSVGTSFGLVCCNCKCQIRNKSAGLGWNITMWKRIDQKTQLGEGVFETNIASSLSLLKIKTVLHCMRLSRIFWKLCLTLLGCPTWMRSLMRTYTVVCKFTKKASSCTECLETHSENASSVTPANVNHLHRITITHDHTSWNLTTLTPAFQREWTQKSSSSVQDNARRELPSRFSDSSCSPHKLMRLMLDFYLFSSINIHKSRGQVSFVDQSSCSGSNCQFWTEPPWLGGLSWAGDRERNLLSQHISAFGSAEPNQAKFSRSFIIISQTLNSQSRLHLSRLRTRWAGLGQEPENWMGK